MYRKGPDACDIGGLGGTAHGIFEQPGAQAAPLPIAAHGKSRQQHDWNGMAGQTLPKPLGCIVKGNLAHNERIEADRPAVRQSQVGLGRAGFLIGERKADEIAVERFVSAIETVNA